MSLAAAVFHLPNLGRCGEDNIYFCHVRERMKVRLQLESAKKVMFAAHMQQLTQSLVVKFRDPDVSQSSLPHNVIGRLYVNQHRMWRFLSST